MPGDLGVFVRLAIDLAADTRRDVGDIRTLH